MNKFQGFSVKDIKVIVK